jgi:hypothetical protein
VVAAHVVEDVPMKIQRNTNRPVEIGHPPGAAAERHAHDPDQ